MGDRYVRSGRRSPIYDYGRTSLPSVSTTYYPGDVHTTPVTTRYETAVAQPRHSHHHRHSSSTTSSDWRGPNVPVTTTTYTVRKDPITRSSSVREHSRTRSGTLDTASKRPPIIVTTRQPKESSSSAAHTSSSRDAPHSPVPDRDRDRHGYKADDGYFISQPASSIRSHSHSRYGPERDSRRASGIMSSTLDDEEFRRLRQRTNDERLAPSWNDSRNDSRRERPSSYYGNPSRHSATSGMGDSGYEYTGPGALLRYDLDHDRRASYHRPTVTVSDLERRPYDNRARGPPPTTRGLDKVNRRVVDDPTAGIYDRPSVLMPVPPAVAAVPPPDRRASLVDIPPAPIERRNGHRPTSMVYQDDYPSRDPRARDYYREEDVGSRGLGPRGEGEKKKELPREDLAPPRERRRDPRVEEREPRRPSDDDNDRYDRQYGRDLGRKEEAVRLERKTTRDDSPRDDDRDKTKLRDKVATGLSLAAGAIGLGGALSASHKEDKDDKGSPRRRADDEARREDDEERPKPSRREHEDRSRDDAGSPGPADKTRRDRDADDVDERDRNRRDAEARLNGDAAAKDSNSSSDETKPRRRRHRPSSAFKPNDTASLMALKEQLRAQEEADTDNEKVASKNSPERRASPPAAREGEAEEPARSSKEDLRGRGATPPTAKEAQARVVSPPRDKDDKKPIKGILKQPRPQFPEEPNPVREGVAPHKDDKSKGNVPPGARWTKISRKLVNPEALTVGKERFEVRDDFVIVLRVLNKEEIEAYTAATAQLRGGLLPFPFSWLSFRVLRPPAAAASIVRCPLFVACRRAVPSTS